MLRYANDLLFNAFIRKWWQVIANASMPSTNIWHRYTGLSPRMTVWGAIGYRSRSPLLRTNGALVSGQYISVGWKLVALVFIQAQQNVTFRQCNARPPVASITRKFFWYIFFSKSRNNRNSLVNGCRDNGRPQYSASHFWRWTVASPLQLHGQQYLYTPYSLCATQCLGV